jgi:hypothetical protein
VNQCRRRRWAVRALILAAGVGLFLSVLLVWTQLTYFHSSGFSSRSAAAFRDDAVQRRLGELVAAQLIDGRPVLEPARPALETGILTGLDAFASDERLVAAIRLLHQRLFEEDTGRLLLSLTDLAEQIRLLLAAAAPDAASQIQGRLPEVEVAVIKVSDARVRLLRLAHDMRLATYVLPVLTVACLVGAMLAATDKRGAVRIVTRVLQAEGLLLFVATFVGAEVTSALTSDASADAARAIWWAFVKGLWLAAVALVGVGISTAAVADLASRIADARQTGLTQAGARGG